MCFEWICYRLLYNDSFIRHMMVNLPGLGAVVADQNLSVRGSEGFGSLPNDLTDLLMDREFTNDSDWQYREAKLNAFYVRGVSSFVSEVYRGPLSYIAEQKSKWTRDYLFSDHPHWKVGGFMWSEGFSPRNAQNSLSLTARKPVTFSNAVKSILICHKLLLEAIGNGTTMVDRDFVLRQLRIEPAIYYIRDFNKISITSKTGLPYEDALEVLRDASDQTDVDCIRDWAERCTGTKRSIEKLHKGYTDKFPGINIGVVDYRYSRSYLGGASIHERLS